MPHPLPNNQPITLLDPGCWYKFINLMTNSADPDLDINCLQRQDISGFSRTRVNFLINSILVIICGDMTFKFVQVYLISILDITVITLRLGQTGLSKQWIPRSDAAKRDIWPGSTLLWCLSSIVSTHQHVVMRINSNYRTNMVRSPKMSQYLGFIW